MLFSSAFIKYRSDVRCFLTPYRAHEIDCVVIRMKKSSERFFKIKTYFNMRRGKHKAYILSYFIKLICEQQFIYFNTDSYNIILSRMNGGRYFYNTVFYAFFGK